MEPTSQAASDSTPGELSAADRRRAELGLPIRDERPINIPGVADDGTSGLGESGTPGLTPGTGPAGFGGGSGGESMAGGIPSPIRKPEYVVSLPDPGTVLGTGDANVSDQYPGAMGFSSPSSVGPTGSADLLSPSFNPNLRAPTTGANRAPAKRSRKRSLMLT